VSGVAGTDAEAVGAATRDSADSHAEAGGAAARGSVGNGAARRQRGATGYCGGGAQCKAAVGLAATGNPKPEHSGSGKPDRFDRLPVETGQIQI